MKKIIKFAALTLLSSIFFTSCYYWYEDKKALDTESQPVNLEDFLYEETKINNLQPPVQVIASQGLFSGTIKIAWTEVQNASSYRIERAVIQPDSIGFYTEPEDSDFEVLEKYVYKNTYDDIILSTPSFNNDEYSYKYYYRICAENIKQGLESSSYSNTKEEQTKGLGWLLPTPTNLSATKGKDEKEIKITWDPVPNAVSYSVYRGTNSNGIGMEEIASLIGNKTYYSDIVSDSEKGLEFYYKVCATLSTGASSAFSNLALGYTLKPGAPIPPSNIKVIDGLGENLDSLTVTWDEVNYVGTSSAVLTYSLYRTSSVDSVFTLIQSNIPKSTTSKTITDGIKPGIIYYFYIQSVVEDNGEKNKSSFSTTGPLDEEGNENPDAAFGFLVSSPTDVELIDSQNPGKVLIRWTPAVGSSFLEETPLSYTIFSDSKADGNFANIAADKIDSSTLPLGEDGYYSYEVENQNFFKIATVNTTGIESKKSVTIAPTPSAPINVVVSRTEGGDLLELSPNTNGVYPVKITWSAPVGETPDGYHIYRSTDPNGAFRKISDTPVNSQDLVFIDENETARAGSLYYYKVVSLNMFGQGKKGNDPTNTWGYGAITRDQWFREYNKTVICSQTKLTLMHKPVDTDKLGKETVNGTISGTLSYNAAIAGFGAEITMHYEKYADFYINDNKDLGVYFEITGNTDTTSNMSANGNMHGTVNCIGMYPGKAIYDKLEIKKGAAGGGFYEVETYDLNNTTLLTIDSVNWTVGEER